MAEETQRPQRANDSHRQKPLAQILNDRKKLTNGKVPMSLNEAKEYLSPFGFDIVTDSELGQHLSPEEAKNANISRESTESLGK